MQIQYTVRERENFEKNRKPVTEAILPAKFYLEHTIPGILTRIIPREVTVVPQAGWKQKMNNSVWSCKMKGKPNASFTNIAIIMTKFYWNKPIIKIYLWKTIIKNKKGDRGRKNFHYVNNEWKQRSNDTNIHNIVRRLEGIKDKHTTPSPSIAYVVNPKPNKAFLPKAPWWRQRLQLRKEM